MKTKKLLIILFAVILILPTFGCTPLESANKDSAHNLNANNSLPVACEELNQLEDFAKEHALLNMDFRSNDERKDFFSNYFTQEFEEDKTYFYFMDTTTIETDIFNQYYFYYSKNEVNNKELIYLSARVGGDFDRPPVTSVPAPGSSYYDYHYKLISFGQKSQASEFTYVLTEIEGYQYNKLITVYAEEEIIAKFYYDVIYDHINDEFFLNLLKTYGYQTQIKN